MVGAWPWISIRSFKLYFPTNSVWLWWGTTDFEAKSSEKKESWKRMKVRNINIASRLFHAMAMRDFVSDGGKSLGSLWGKDTVIIHYIMCLTLQILKDKSDFISQRLSGHTVYIYIYIRGGTVHRCHGSVSTSVRGSRFDTISVQQEKKKSTMLGFFSFILNRQLYKLLFFSTRRENTKYYYIVIYIKSAVHIYIYIKGIHSWNIFDLVYR